MFDMLVTLIAGTVMRRLNLWLKVSTINNVTEGGHEDD